MFRAMRRKNKAIGVEEAKRLLATERRGVLAVNGDDGYPYAIPVNYYFDEGDDKIYFHGSRVGHKAEALKNSDKVCFTVYGNERFKEESWAPYLQSVVVFGRCSVIADPLVAGDKLKRFAMKYYPNGSLVDEEIAISGKAVQMYEIAIEHFSGKEIQEK